jgi:hypothetical protein
VPRLPIFLAQATGWWPTLQTVLAQALLATIYAGGAVYAFVIKPRRDRAFAPASPAENEDPLIEPSASTVPA